ncbi:MAG: hypothetical protein ABJB32_03590 [Verrucomicrobiota bacterium]
MSLFFAISACATVRPKPHLLAKANALPLALSDDFEFRKTKLTDLGSPPVAGRQDESIAFERAYRMFGAITQLDRQQRTGNYFDFFWRAKRTANITVRLEYRQEKLRSFVQAREISYSNARGHYKTEFAIVGDDYADDGRVIAWRALLIENGRIVALNRSFLWE